nr:reverse transcriptase domain-containing protein [Tanacetum cinerariifolium]
MAAEGPGDLPVPDLQTMKELCQPSLNGDDANKHLDKFLHVTQSIKVNGVTDDALCLHLFPHSLTHHATAWFHRLPRNSINTFEKMAKMFLGKYFPPSMVTKLINEITNFRQRPDESLFEAWERYKLSIDRCPNHNMFPVTQIDMFYNGLTLRRRDTINVAARGTFMKRRPEEFYDLIENMTAHHNDWDTSAQRSKSSSSITSSFDTEITALKDEMAKINKNLMRVLQVNQQVKAVTPSCETCGGPHSFSDCPATVGNTQSVYAAEAYQAYQAPVYQALVHQPKIPQPQVVTTNEFTNFMKSNDAILKNMQTNMTSLTNSNLELKNMFGQLMKMNTTSSLGSGTLLGNTITNPKEDLKGITTRSGIVYQGPTIPTTSSSSPVVEHKTEATKDTVHPTNNESTEDIQPPVVPTKSLILNSEPVNSPIMEPVTSPVNFDADPRVPLILGRSFLKTGRALIDVFEGELTLRVGKERLKLPIIIVKDLSIEEKTALITVMKSHKRAITWKLSDIKGIDPEFCTHKILMEEDFEPAVQHQRRVNPKIHDVIKQGVLKLLDAGLIYPISNSPWVSPVHCVPKKGGFTVVEKEENELILTRLVTG